MLTPSVETTAVTTSCHVAEQINENWIEEAPVQVSERRVDPRNIVHFGHLVVAEQVQLAA